jgi:hypothetical protein
MKHLFLPCILAFGARAACAQSPTTAVSRPASAAARPAEPVFSIGQPPLWRPYVAGFAMRSDGDWGGAGLVGVSHSILNPVAGALGAAGELYIHRRSGQIEAGSRLLARIPFFGIGAGADWRFTHGALSPVFSFQTAVRRGGLFGGGSTVRLDWLPTRHQTISLGVQVPLMQPLAGRTRPHRTSVEIPGALTPATTDLSVTLPLAADTALATLSRTSGLIEAFTNLYSVDNERTLIADSRDPFAASYTAATRGYRAALADAFSAVVADSLLGDTLAVQARTGVLDDAILPYDALFGQVKDDQGITGMLRVAHDHFAHWIADSSSVPVNVRASVLAVHGRWLAMLDTVCQRQLHQWKDSRLVWMPPQLALAPEQYDDQAEVDALIARAVGRPFTDRNAVDYLRTADLSLEIARSVAAARKYHVLWTHDFTARLPNGALDAVAYSLVADAYLPALTAAVRRYDTTGVFPQYLILADAYYYNGRGGRLWMTLLENPLHARVHLRASEAAQAQHLSERLAELREAVAQSGRLQREAATRGGDAWLSQVVQVHVNIMQPSDFSFRSSRTLPPLPFTPDNVMRDHRKLVLYDYTESNPYDGALLVTGIGIGEHYASDTWEDRGFRIRGPAALETRNQVRIALRANGFSADQIPVPLRMTHDGTPAAARDQAADHVARALQVHNEPGFAPKRSSVARAMLYSLAPPGSVIIVPDPLWLSETWAAMLVGAAARGAQVMIVAPSLANDPNQQSPVIAEQRTVVQRLFAIQREMAAQFKSAGGSLRIGLYASRAPITDVAGRLAEVRAGLAANPWIRRLIPFDSSALAVLNSANSAAGRTDAAATAIASNVNAAIPLLHQKTQFIARPGAIAALVRQPGWDRILAQAIRVQSRATGKLAADVENDHAEPDSAAAQAADSLLQRYQRSIPAAERDRMSFYFAAGSQNHDPRGLMLDGEASVIVSGFPASAGLVDLFYLMSRTTWVRSEADIDRLLPQPRGLLAKLAHFIRFAM